MKRAALLTTWEEVCGIAHYSSFLKRALDPHVDVTVIPTPRPIIHGAQTKAEIKAADALIDSIAEQVREFDVTIIQYEPGLYGRDQFQSLKRLAKVIEGSRDLVIAFHHFHREKRISAWDVIRPLRPKPVIRNAINFMRSTRLINAWRKLYETIEAHGRSHKVTAIAHTKRDARYLKFEMPSIEVLDNPLSYMDEGYIAGLDELTRGSHLRQLLPEAEPEKRYIGVFGFYSGYKGFDTAITALKHLPGNYELLMFSGVHESTLTTDQGISPYLQWLINIAKKEKLLSRIRFLGSVTDDDMLLGMMVCDAVVVPYINSVHTASGPASQAIELNRQVYCSRNQQFTELAKYFPDNFEFIDIGNSVELAQKILRNAGTGKDRDVNGIRFVEYPNKPRPVTIDDTITNYLRAIGANRRTLSQLIAAE